MAARGAIFLDKDGTLIPDVPYNVDPDKISLYDGVIAGLTLLKSQYMFFIISNQSGLAKGYFGEADLAQAVAKIKELTAKHEIEISGFYYCPHDELNKECNCRKPKPGLITKAALDHEIDLQHSWMIGDILHDVEAGKLAGCRAVLINNGNETEWMGAGLPHRTPEYTCGDFFSAAAYIFKKTP